MAETKPCLPVGEDMPLCADMPVDARARSTYLANWAGVRYALLAFVIFPPFDGAILVLT